MHFRCKCHTLCMKKVSSAEVKAARRMFWSKTSQERKQWFHTQFCSSRVGTKLRVPNGPIVCAAAFSICLGLSRALFFKMKSHVCQLCNVCASPRAKQKTKSVASILCMNWLEDYITKRGDSMPHKDEVRLPYGLAKKDIYQQYLEDMTDTWEPTVGKSMFYQLWKNYFDHVKVKKSGDFSKCQKCVVLQRKLDEEINQSKRKEIKSAMKMHNDRQMLERQLYYRKRGDAKKNKVKYLSMIIDGMDQSKTNIPNFTGDKAKGINDKDLLKTHVTGVVLHGQQESLTFVDVCQHSHDSNMTINILLKTLGYVSKGQPLPPILYLQADNCWRENKNKYVMAFCELLVGKKIFHEVQISFLLVGHTHEDVDQLFSQIGRKLQRKPAETMPQLLSLLPNSEEIVGLFDFKSWMNPHISSVRGHTQPHHFRFSMNEEGRVIVSYKGIRAQEWKDLERGFWQQTATGRPVYPRGRPALLEPCFDKINLDKLVERVEDWCMLFQDQSSQQLWMGYLQGLVQVRDQRKARKEYMAREVRWVLPRLVPYDPQHLAEDEGGSDGPAIAPQLQEKLDEEVQEPRVHVARRNRQL